jgi:H+/gluconate symporter-like permease
MFSYYSCLLSPLLAHIIKYHISKTLNKIPFRKPPFAWIIIPVVLSLHVFLFQNTFHINSTNMERFFNGNNCNIQLSLILGIIMMMMMMMKKKKKKKKITFTKKTACRHD